MSPANKSRTDKKSKIGWWQRWITAAKKKAKPHWDDAKAAYDEYERMGRNRTDAAEYGDKAATRGYPIYTTSCKTLEAAYYSRTPKTRSKRLYGIEDELALTMSLIADRAGQFLIDHGNFDEAMQAACGDYIHAAKATTQAIYSTETEPYRVPLNLLPNRDGSSSYYEGDKPYDGEDEVLEDDDGFYYEGTRAVEETQRIFLAPARYDKILHTPDATTQPEITEFAYYFCMSKEEAEEKFNTNPDGSKKGLKISYTKSKDYDDESEKITESSAEQLEGWECYCFETRKLYWVSEGYKDGFLGEEVDPYGLRGFIPSPNFIISNKHRNSMFSTPTFVYLESTCNQLHELYFRVFTLISSIERKAIVWGLSPEIIGALNRIGGAQYLNAGSIDDLLSKADITKYVQFLPVQELVDSLSECLKIEEHFKQLFYEWFRLPDILRGVSDPVESLGAQEIKTDAATDSFKFDKKRIVDLARDSAEIMLDLALKVWSDEKFAQVCGLEFMEAGTPGTEGTPAIPPSPENPQGVPETPPIPPKLGHKERFFDALARLRNDKERIVRIDFETDSTSFRDEAKETARQQLISQTVLQGLAQISSIEHPGNMRIATQMLLGVLESMGGTSQSEDMIKAAVEDLKKEKHAPLPPPPPDYEGMKVQVQMQKNEIAAQKDQIQGANDARELGQKEFALGLQEAQQSFEQQLAVAVEQGKTAQARFDQQLQLQKQQSDTQLNAFQATLDQALVAVEQQRVLIEAFQAKSQATESAMEEVRLAKEASTEAVSRVMEFLQTQTPEAKAETKAPAAAPMMPNITIVNEGKASRGYTLLRDDGTKTRIEPDASE